MKVVDMRLIIVNKLIKYINYQDGYIIFKFKL